MFAIIFTNTLIHYIYCADHDILLYIIHSTAHRMSLFVSVQKHRKIRKLMKDKNGKYPCPTLYDISGSAHWRNKADNGIAVFRHVDNPEWPVEIHVQKIRFKAVGRIGVAKLKYNTVTGRYKDPNAYFSQSFIEVPA